MALLARAIATRGPVRGLKQARTSAAEVHGGGRGQAPTGFAASSPGSSTAFSGSSQNAHTAAPTTSSPAATTHRATPEPTCTSNPKTIGHNAPPEIPALRLDPDTG